MRIACYVTAMVGNLLWCLTGWDVLLVLSGFAAGGWLGMVLDARRNHGSERV